MFDDIPNPIEDRNINFEISYLLGYLNLFVTSSHIVDLSVQPL